MFTSANHDTVRASPNGFRAFRRSRPFWAGVFTLLSGLIVLFPPYASLRFGDAVISMNTMGGISSLVIGIVLVACAVSFWAQPHLRVPAGVVTLILALVAIVTSNLGSFLVGTLLGVIGAALALAWSPQARKRRRGSQRQRSAERTTTRPGSPAEAAGMTETETGTSRQRGDVSSPHGAGA